MAFAKLIVRSCCVALLGWLLSQSAWAADGADASRSLEAESAPAPASAPAEAPTAATAEKQTKPAGDSAAARSELAAGATGSFSEPQMKLAERSGWGVAHGNAAPVEPTAEEQPAATAAWAFLIATLVGAAAVAGLAYFNTRTTDLEGKPTRAFTMGAKLTLAFGGLTVLLMGVGTITLFSMNDNARDGAEYNDIVGDRGLLSDFQTDVLMVRMNVKDFLLTNSEEDLGQYSDYIASAAAKLDVTAEEIADPERVEILGRTETMLDDYQRAFDEVVRVIDQRNGVIESQMNPAAARGVALLKEIERTAYGDGDTEAAHAAAEALDTFMNVRIEFFKYARSGDPAIAQNIETLLARLDEQLVEMDAQIENPIRRKWVAEADQICDFYGERLRETVRFVEQRNEIVDGRLDVIGPKIAAAGVELVESIKGTMAEMDEEAEAERAAMMLKITGSIGAAILLSAAVALVLIRALSSTVQKVLHVLRAIAAGDLTVEPLGVQKNDELGLIAQSADTTLRALIGLITEVRSAANEVASGSTEIAASAEEMATGINEQNQQVTQISSAVEEMSSSIVEVARKSGDAAKSAGDSGDTARQGGEIVQQTIAGMHEINDAVSSGSQSVQSLGERSEQIGQIVEVINDIAEQTNLLALNAAIEAARAGEHGRGFAVVADEVRKLADRTTKATDEISTSIEAIQTETKQAVERMAAGTERVQAGVSLAGEAGESLETIVTAASGVAEMIRSIAAAAEQQSAASEEISQGVDAVASVSKQSNEGAQQAAAAAAQLSQKAEGLMELVGRFRVD